MNFPNLYTNTYDMFNLDSRLNKPTYETGGYSKELLEVIEQLKESIVAEKEDELFYSFLLSKATDEEDKRIIKDIRDTEIKHAAQVRELFYFLTGVNPMTLPMPKIDEKQNENLGYLTLLKKAFFGELDAVKRYRHIRKIVPTEMYKEILFSILTDEIVHSNLYNYLISKNR